MWKIQTPNGAKYFRNLLPCFKYQTIFNIMSSFSHLHVHTQYSLLDGAASIKALYKKAIDDKMPALAISDHGNMFGVFQFVAEAYKNRTDPDDKKSPLKIKPIVGCEFYITENRHRKTFSKEEKDPRHHQILLAKN
ncbi:MAG: PHP domain-containing protein, partial [Chitinophagaceae bacterium]